MSCVKHSDALINEGIDFFLSIISEDLIFLQMGLS